MSMNRFMKDFKLEKVVKQSTREKMIKENIKKKLIEHQISSEGEFRRRFPDHFNYFKSKDINFIELVHDEEYYINNLLRDLD